MRTAYKCQAYPDQKQASVLNRTFGCVRVVWNRTLAWRQQRYQADNTGTTFTQANAYLTATKATEELAWLNEVPSVPLQQAIRPQQAAYAAFFARRARYPRFKSRNGRQPAEYTRSGFRWRDGRLYLVKMDTPLDLGITDFAVTSDGQRVANPRYLARRARNLARYQRRLARCQKGSANRAKAKGKVARAHRKVRAARTDFLHKASTSLVCDHDVIVLENLAVTNMIRDRTPAKAIADCGWGTSAPCSSTRPPDTDGA